MRSILHVRDKLTEIIRVSELGYAAGFTASELGKPEFYFPGVGFRPYGPVSYIPDSIYAKVGNCLTGEAAFRKAEALCDVSGGNQATFPYEGDFMHPETKDLLYKYITGNPDVHPEDAAQLWHYVDDLACSAAGGSHDYGAFHGGGSPIMEAIAITTQ